MPKLIIQTDSGRLVGIYDLSKTEPHALRNAKCEGNLGGSNVVSWLRRAFEDALIVEGGGDPERPSEKVMRLMAEETAGE